MLIYRVTEQQWVGYLPSPLFLPEDHKHIGSPQVHTKGLENLLFRSLSQ